MSGASQNETNSQTAKQGVPLSNATSVEAEARKKEKIQKAIKQFVGQIKVGCNKHICFSAYCQKNLFGRS